MIANGVQNARLDWIGEDSTDAMMRKGQKMENYINKLIEQLEQTRADSITQIYDFKKNDKKYHLSIFIQETEDDTK